MQQRGMEEMKYSIFEFGIMVAVVSFLGFMVENLWLAATKGYVNNRNMNLPFLLGYGLLVLFIFLVLGTPGELAQWGIFRKIRSQKWKYAVYFICSFMAVCIGEVMLGVFVERLCGFEYWNYSRIPMHITKYTSVPTSIGFASLITFFMGNCFEPLMGWVSRMDSFVFRIVSMVLMIAMTYDFFYSFYHMFAEKDFYLKWQIRLSGLRGSEKTVI